MHKNSKHIHEVLFMMQIQNNVYKNEEELLQSVKDVFGEDIVFESCNDNNITLDKVIPFLLQKQKIVIHQDNSISLHPEMTMCNGHEEGHHHHDH